MPPTDRVRATLARYAEPLLRDVTARLGRPGLGGQPPGTPGAAPPRPADGLAGPLRLAVAGQRVDERRAGLPQPTTFFKRALLPLRADPLLTPAPPDQLAAVAEPGVLAL